jgi:hypothetical protein
LAETFTLGLLALLQRHSGVKAFAETAQGVEGLMGLSPIKTNCIIGIPTVGVHIDAAIGGESDFFVFEKGSSQFGFKATGDGAIGVYNTLPGEVFRASPHGESDSSGGAGAAG